ncbi:hypothetical protein AMS68_001385 [Peltaster fructicola]|uniref:Uncharacterized protein n=1 Tax=Peltaster fructicola TaxID=286661 RepID=A0A6H0XML7_9PEZI|nr:hypothetical protein AMS68_001385 [Peltaster fructicola]
MLRDNPRSWRNYVALARSVIAHLDSTGYMQQADQVTEQAYIVNALQRIAFADADNGALTDIDTWAARQWLQILQRDARNVIALRGMGWAWLQRAQPALSRIHRVDGSSSSSGGSSSQVIASVLNGDEDRFAEQANAEAERRAGTADYVEARGFLQPSTEYLARAVAAALSQEIRLLRRSCPWAMRPAHDPMSPIFEELYSFFVQQATWKDTVCLLIYNSKSGALQKHKTDSLSYLDDFGRLVD